MNELKNYLFLILSFLTLFPLSLFFTKPAIEKTMEKNTFIASQKEKLSKLGKKTSLLLTLDDFSLSQNVKKLNYILPSEKNIDSLISSLNKFANESSLPVSNISFTPGIIVQDEKIKKIAAKKEEFFEVKISFNGEMKELRLFLGKIKNNLLALKVKSLKISRTQEEGKIVADLLLTAYYKPVSLVLGEAVISEMTEKENLILKKIENISFTEESNPLPVSSGEKRDPFF